MEGGGKPVKRTASSEITFVAGAIASLVVVALGANKILDVIVSKREMGNHSQELARLVDDNVPRKSSPTFVSAPEVAVENIPPEDEDVREFVEQASAVVKGSVMVLDALQQVGVAIQEEKRNVVEVSPVSPPVVQHEISGKVHAVVSVPVHNDPQKLQEPQKPLADPNIAVLSSLRQVLDHVDWEKGIHHDLVAGTAIIETNHGRVAGLVINEKSVIIPASFVQPVNTLKLMRGGEAYKAQKSKWIAGTNAPLNIRLNAAKSLALVTSDVALFPAKTGLAFSPHVSVELGQSLFVCGNPHGKEARTRDGGLVLEKFADGRFALGVQADSGFLGGTVADMHGNIVGVVEALSNRTFETRTPYSNMKKMKSLVVHPVAGASVQQIMGLFR